MCISMGGGAGDSIAARNAELTRQNDTKDGIRNIDNIFNSQFTDDYFKGRSKAFLDYANPQLNDQFADARKELTYFLDRNGTLNSTVRTGKDAELAKLFDVNKRAVADKGLDFENNARNSVADARAGLVSQVIATGDENAAATNAQSRASLLTQPDTYEPLGQLFTTFTSGLGMQAGLEKANAYAGTGVGQSQIGNYNTGLFGPRHNAVQVTP